MLKSLQFFTKRFRTLFLMKTILLLSVIFFNSLSAQGSGKIIGKVVDNELGEGVIGCNILIDGTTIGAAADINGNYTIENIPEGTYSVVFSSIGFSKKTVTDVEVKAGQIFTLNITLFPEAYQTDEVVITAKAAEDSDAGLLVKRQKSANVSDAVGADQFKRNGSSTAADAVKQVVGASVVDGKYIYVRGMGDRYTSTQLNGAEIPSVDPYHRGGSIDIIPADLIDNIQAVKSFTPDKPGDFSGGSVDIATKDFPDKLNFSFKSGAGYNSEISLNKNGLTSSVSSTDWLGFDDGKRALPNIVNGILWEPEVGAAQRDNAEAQKIDDVTKAFSYEMTPSIKTVPINQSYSLSVGNQVLLFGKPLGFIASFSYKNSNSGYFDGQLNRWSRGVADQNKTQLDVVFDQKDTKSTNNVLLGAVVKASYKFHPYHIISINGLFNQNGINTARYVRGSYPYDMDETWLFEARTIHYQERSLGSFQLNGEHSFPKIFGIKFNWQGSLISSKQDEPDLRYFYDYMTPDSVYGIKSNNAPERYYRKTNEKQKEFHANFTIPFTQWSGYSGNIKFGGRYSEKNRVFNERRFVYSPANQIGVFLRNVDGDINRLFSAEYLGWTKTDTLNNGITLNKIPVYIQESDQISSDYNGQNYVRAAYAMVDFPVFANLRLIAGARYETTFMNVESRNPDIENGTIDTKDLLPSVNVIYNVFDNMNLRFSYGKTLARPNFREISPFKNYDFNGGDTYIGNPALERTLIDNYDFRWEWYTNPGEIYSVSLFYKKFINPIELKIQDGVNNLMTWENVPSANVQGIELEVRKNLNVIHQSLSEFMLGANFSYIVSKVDIAEDELASIRQYEPDASSTRPFQGQSPYLVNLFVNYDNVDAGVTASIYYNVFGKRLAAVGSVGAPDVYEKPFQMLNLSVTKSLMENLSIKVAAKNILNSSMEKIQEFKGNEYIYQSYKLGTGIDVELKYKL